MAGSYGDSLIEEQLKSSSRFRIHLVLQLIISSSLGTKNPLGRKIAPCHIQSIVRRYSRGFLADSSLKPIFHSIESNTFQVEPIICSILSYLVTSDSL
jgi:hypothetical protein